MEKISDYEVTERDIGENGVQAVQGEVLYGDPAENKRLFDRLPTFIIEKYNAALRWLVDKAHAHENKDVIDGITQNLVSYWNLMSGVEDGNADFVTKEEMAAAFDSILDAETVALAEEVLGIDPSSPATAP